MQVTWLEQQSVRRRVKRTASRSDYWKWSWNDPLWPKMWYLVSNSFRVLFYLFILYAHQPVLNQIRFINAKGPVGHKQCKHRDSITVVKTVVKTYKN